MPSEVPHLHIEISVLTSPQTLKYERPTDLPGLLRPGIDGVTLRDGFNRATYLPQVWEKLPDPREFLGSLCTKMGAAADLWMQKVLHVQVYQVIMFEEAPPEPGGQPQK
jgi:AMMECR1 domain-containing protein